MRPQCRGVQCAARTPGCDSSVELRLIRTVAATAAARSGRSSMSSSLRKGARRHRSASLQNAINATLQYAAPLTRSPTRRSSNSRDALLFDEHFQTVGLARCQTARRCRLHVPAFASPRADLLEVLRTIAVIRNLDEPCCPRARGVWSCSPQPTHS